MRKSNKKGLSKVIDLTPEQQEILNDLDNLEDADADAESLDGEDLNADAFAENFLNHKTKLKSGEIVNIPVKPYLIFPSGFNKLIKVSANKKNYVVYEFYFNDVANLTRAVGTVLKIYIPSWLCFNLKNGGWCIGVDAINYNADLINYLDELSKKRAHRVKLVF